MYDPTTWGTIAEWAGSLLTGLSVLGAAIVYAFDRRRDNRAQAGAILVWLHPYEHGAPEMKMFNLSDRPVFDHGYVITSRPRRKIAQLAREGWSQNHMFKWPDSNEFSCHERRSLLNYHDGSELYLGPGQLAQSQLSLEFNDVVYDYYAYFRDGAGKYWAADARTQRLLGQWRRWRLGIGPRGLDAT